VSADARGPCTKTRSAAEHGRRARGLPIRDHAFANAPGRPEGRREHTSLAISRDATGATASVASRREPDAYVAGFSPRTFRTLRVALPGGARRRRSEAPRARCRWGVALEEARERKCSLAMHEDAGARLRTVAEHEASRFAITPSRMRPAGPRGGASTRASRSRETRRAREPDECRRGLLPAPAGRFVSPRRDRTRLEPGRAAHRESFHVKRTEGGVLVGTRQGIGAERKPKRMAT
jgi:hypothetical protein